MAKHYTMLHPDELWKILAGRIFKGGGNQTDPKLVRSKGLRSVDFDIRLNPATKVPTVYPHPRKGLSFSTTIERLAKLGIEGEVWEFAEPSRLPPGLVINFEAPDHPLLNVVCPLPVKIVELRLKELAKQMRKTGVKISSQGKVVPS